MELENNFKTSNWMKIYQKNLQNRRLWAEFVKVLISSDLILYVLDSRDPIGTFFNSIQKKIQKANKKLILILNKCDLVPTWVITSWIKSFSNENLVIAFNSSSKGQFGKGSLINIIRQIKNVYFQKKKNLIIGIIGFPNVGKSSLINSLKGKKVVQTSSKAGETKVWKFIKLFKKIFIIDSPGIIPNMQRDSVLKIFREGCYSQKFLNPTILEISSIVKTIDQLINCNYLKKIKKKSYLKNQIYHFPRIQKGGELDKNFDINKKFRHFFNGDSSWFAPLPRKKLKKQKLLKKKFWFFNKDYD